MTPEERAQLERLLANTAPSEWGQQSKWLSDFGRMDDGRVYGPQQFDLGATASLMNPTAFEFVNSAPQTPNPTHYGPQAPDLMTDYGQLVGAGALEAMQTGERVMSAGERLSWATSTGAPQEEVDAIFEDVRENRSTYGTMYRERGIPDGIAEVLGLGTALFEFDPMGPAGAAVDVARVIQNLPKAIALLPGVPIAMQRLIAQRLPPMLLDMDNLPLGQYHAPGRPVAGEIGMGNAELHGNWGFFQGAPVENSLGYVDRYEQGAGPMIQGVTVPRDKDASVLYGSNFPGNSRVGAEAPPFTVADLNSEQQASLQHIADKLLEMARAADADNGYAPGSAVSYARDLETRLSGFTNPNSNANVVDTLNQFQNWAHDLMRTSDRAQEIGIRDARLSGGTFTDGAWAATPGETPRMRDTRFLPNETTQLPEKNTPAFSFTDLADRLGFDTAVGPLTTNEFGEIPYRPRNELFGTEVASYRPQDNFLQTSGVTVEQIGDDMIRMGIATPEEVRAAMNSPIPETNFLLGNQVIDVDKVATDLVARLNRYNALDELHGAENADALTEDIVDLLAEQLDWGEKANVVNMLRVPGMNNLIENIFQKARGVVGTP